jgi:hypothetical protein
LQNITGTKAATSFFCVLRWLFLLKTTKLLSIILKKTNQKFSFWLSRVLLWAEVLPKDGMVDVTTAVKPKGRLEVDDGFGVVWNHSLIKSQGRYRELFDRRIRNCIIVLARNKLFCSTTHNYHNILECTQFLTCTTLVD